MRTIVRTVAVLTVAAAVSVFSLDADAQAKVPATLLVEGVLTGASGGPAADGNYVVTFGLYDKSAAGKKVWASAPKTVAVKGGRFAVRLGTSKPITGAALANLQSAWLGMKVGSDPEFKRVPLNSVPYAIRAAWAHNVECKGCLNSGHIASGSIKPTSVGFAYAGAADGIKGGDAKVARALKCTGCVTVAHMKFDKDVNLGPRSLSAAKLTSSGDVVAAGTIAGKQFIGDGSKLTGIKTPAGECKNKGEVVKGINADGSLKCVKSMDPSALPKDGIDEISNGMIANQFIDTIPGGKNRPIPDNNPPGVLDTINFPDIGIAQEIEVNVHIKNSDLGNLVVWLFPPNAPNLPANRTPIIKNYPVKPEIDAKVYPHYLLHRKNGKKGATLNTTYPTKTKTLTGDIHKDWLNKNIKGKWRLLVTDTAFLNNKIDGAIVSWDIKIKTLSNKQISVNGSSFTSGTVWGKYQGSGKPGGTLNVGGDQVVNGKLIVKGGIQAPGQGDWYAPGMANSRRYVVVIAARDKKHCPKGFNVADHNTLKGANGYVYWTITRNGYYVGDHNGSGKGHHYIYTGVRHNNGINAWCWKEYHAPTGKPYTSIFTPKGNASTCPPGYTWLDRHWIRGNNNWTYILQAAGGTYMGYIDTWEYTHRSDEGHASQRRQFTDHADGICFRVYGTTEDEDTQYGVYPVMLGMHHNPKECPKGWILRSTTQLDGSNGWMYNQMIETGHISGGMHNWWYGGHAYGQTHWANSYVRNVCMKFFPLRGNPYATVRATHYSDCPTGPGWYQFTASNLKGWNNHGYVQMTQSNLYIGGLHSWSTTDHENGYHTHTFTSHINRKICLKLSGVKH